MSCVALCPRMLVDTCRVWLLWFNFKSTEQKSALRPLSIFKMKARGLANSLRDTFEKRLSTTTLQVPDTPKNPTTSSSTKRESKRNADPQKSGEASHTASSETQTASRRSFSRRALRAETEARRGADTLSRAQQRRSLPASRPGTPSAAARQSFSRSLASARQSLSRTRKSLSRSLNDALCHSPKSFQKLSNTDEDIEMDPRFENQSQFQAMGNEESGTKYSKLNNSFRGSIEDEKSMYCHTPSVVPSTPTSSTHHPVGSPSVVNKLEMSASHTFPALSTSPSVSASISPIPHSVFVTPPMFPPSSVPRKSIIDDLSLPSPYSRSHSVLHFSFDKATAGENDRADTDADADAFTPPPPSDFDQPNNSQQRSSTSTSTSTWYLTHKHWSSDRFMLKWFGAKSLVEWLVLMWPMFDRDARIFSEYMTDRCWCPSVYFPLVVFQLMLGYHCCIFIYAAWRFSTFCSSAIPMFLNFLFFLCLNAFVVVEF